jgi:Uma2 family endonuclease
MSEPMATDTLREARAKSLQLPLTLRLPKTLELTDEQFLELSSLNRDLRLELTSQGDLIVMPPAGGGSGKRNARINYQLMHWSLQDGTGEVFDSSTGFRLPNGAVRSPDASWVSKARLEPLSAQEQEKFLPLCPEFVIELRSPTDSLQALKEKMQEYLDNGAKLGWLIDPQRKRVLVYTPKNVEELENPEALHGDPLLPGFRLGLLEVWG